MTTELPSRFGMIVARCCMLAASAALACAVPVQSAYALGNNDKVDFSNSIGPGYQPIDDDEKGLWMRVNEVERDFKHSKFIIKDPALNEYVRNVLCRTVGEAECADIRLYIMRTPHFNASMAPNGMMQIWSGLLLRVQNEAQLAAILAHEYAHYTRRHSLQSFRNIRRNTGRGLFFSMIIPFAGLLTVDSIFSFSREMEREADRLSLGYLERAGYSAIEASRIWEQLRAEQDATAAERQIKSRKDKTGGLFATHPNSRERMEILRDLVEQAPEAGQGDINRSEYLAAVADWWPRFIDDQIKRNDFGGTEFLLNQLAETENTPQLHYAKAELYRARGAEGDFAIAVSEYELALQSEPGFAAAMRGMGLALLRMGQRGDGQAFLRQYIEAAPDAPDIAMMKMMGGM
ncbi:M48 family metalloprotease [Alterisphingorhabdus coralli]|uniref:M48 family metalloprotease n=1 Tax=Alterisphingorhabdus coralli TaxID=3071408 RepID=A0AA97I175_9SPHN|nr:M48 family metalloprotease [Parasphingorhabdus sp. SCSIO 66989]WOE76444.1 M48 family metalloprotease [Parasphingorhabdus sp. SCSIO 66989]